MRIIFYDGYCPMCHAWVRRIIRQDRQKQFYFAALESQVAERELSGRLPSYREENTIIYLEDDRVYLRSTAVLKIAQSLGFPSALMMVGWLLPRFFRDALYDLVASRRYRYGRRYDECPVPPPEWRTRFLDL